MPDSLLRVLTCGSVDDGKSTLIGRLLFECGSIPDDVMLALERDSVRFGTVEGGVDYALLVDGLEAEREQGVTIDVAYRFFETPRRRFILADTPGSPAIHAQHGDRRLDRRSGDPAGRCAQRPARPDPPPCRHRLAAGHPLGRARDQQDGPRRFRPDGIRRASSPASTICAADWASLSVTAIPICARDGDNVTGNSARMPWYSGDDAARGAGKSRAAVARERQRRVAFPGAIRQPPRPVVSRLRRNRRIRNDPGRRQTDQHRLAHRGEGRAHRDHGWRSCGRPCRAAGDAGAGSGNRCLPRRRAGRRSAADPRRPDQRLGRLDGRNAVVPRPRLSVHAGHEIGRRHDHRYHQSARYRHVARDRRS